MRASLSRLFSQKFRIALVGKPNVGKSTLFNKLSMQTLAITHPEPNLTRDCQWTRVCHVLPVPFYLADTPGLPETKGELELQMLQSLKDAVRQSDLIIFVVDCKGGVDATDRRVLSFLRAEVPEHPLLLLANKADSEEVELEGYNDVYGLRLPEVVFASAETGYKLQEVWAALGAQVGAERVEQFRRTLKARREKISAARTRWLDGLFLPGAQLPLDRAEAADVFDRLNREAEYLSDLDELPSENCLYFPKVRESAGVSYDSQFKNNPVRVAFVGRPNSGKSALVNALLGNTRCATSEEAHTTRDAVPHAALFRNRRVVLIDTAGQARSMKDREGSLAFKIFMKTLRDARLAQLNVVVLDALCAFRDQDFVILQKAAEEGRGLLVVVNKWDLVEAKWQEKARRYMQQQIRRHLGSERSAPLLFLSARTRAGVDGLRDAILAVYEQWNARISTGVLNAWLQRFKKLPENDYKSFLKRQTLLELRYVTQRSTRPPAFTFFVNDREQFKPHVLKFFKAKLVEEFRLYGVPVRLRLQDNSHKNLRRKLLLVRRQRQTRWARRRRTEVL